MFIVILLYSKANIPTDEFMITATVITAINFLVIDYPIVRG